MKQKHFIDSHKGATTFAILGMMAWFGAWDNETAWLYLALHGSYGFMWMVKSVTFPDKTWEAPTGLPYGLYIWSGLSLFWIAPWLITSRDLHAPPWLIGAASSVYAFGVLFHFASDMQKHVSLQLNPGHLFTTGLWARCRNPNYFGELLIYGGFSALAMHWAPMLVLALFLVIAWIPNMRRKDKSLQRYPEFAAWKSRSTLFIPFLI